MDKPIHIENIFPTPVGFSKYDKDISKELEFIKNLEFKTSIPTNNQPSKNNYLGECKELSNLMKFFTESANAFAKQIYNINEPLYITQCWANKLIKGAVVGEHSHQNSIISGVFYLQLNLGHPMLQLKRIITDTILPSMSSIGGEGLFNVCGDSVMFPMKVGELIMAQGSLRHCTFENRSAEPRMSIAFNTFSKVLGSKDTLTHLDVTKLK